MLARRRAHRHVRWSLIGGRYGHTRDLVISFQIVLPTGEIIEVGEGAGGRSAILHRVPAQTPVHGSPGHAGIVTEATLELVPRPEVEFAAFHYPSYRSAWDRPALWPPPVWPRWRASCSSTNELRYLRRDDEAYIPRPDHVKAVVHTAGTRDEVEPAAKHCSRITGIRRPTSGMRSAVATGRRVTTDTPPHSTAGSGPARWSR